MRGNLATCAADVTKSDQVKACIAATVGRFGKIDVLFSNAGNFGTVAPVTDFPEEVFDAVIAVHVKGAFLAAKHTLPMMNDGGSIIITSSIVGVKGDPGACAYITAKHAQVGLMRVLAKEAAGRNIRVNTIHPGPVDNDFQLNVEQHLSGALGRDATAVLQRHHPAQAPRPRRGDRPLRALSRLRRLELHHRQPVDGGRRLERVNDTRKFDR